MFGLYTNKHGQLTGKQQQKNVSDVMLLYREEKDQGLENGSFEKMINGKDKMIWGSVLKISNGRKERPLQHLYPLELSRTQTKSH